MTLPTDIENCLGDYEDAVREIAKAPDGLTAQMAYVDKRNARNRLESLLKEEISKAVDDVLSVFRSKLLAWDVEFNSKYLYGSGDGRFQSYTYQLNLLVEEGEDEYSPKLGEKECLDAFLDKTKTQVLSE